MALSYSNRSAILQRVLLKKANRVTQATDARSLLSILREPYLVQFTVFLVAYLLSLPKLSRSCSQNPLC
jgi:hypothetical protein